MIKRIISILLIFSLACTTFLPIGNASASAEGIVLTLETNKQEVNAGEEFTYLINYSASSTVSNFTNPKIRLILPEGVTYIGKTDSSITDSSSIDSVDYPGRKEVVFTFRDGVLPAGSTGQLIVKGKFENYVTPNGTAATTKATFYGAVNGTPVSLDSNEVMVTSQAEANWSVEIKKNRPVVEPFKGSDVEYEILVKETSTSSTGRLDVQNMVVTAKLADGAVLLSANQGGTAGPDNTVVWNLPDGVRSQQKLSFIVNYPAYLAATEVENRVEATFTPLGQTPTTISASVTHGFATQPIPVPPELKLETEPTQKEISPGQTVKIHLSGLENKSNMELTSVIAEVFTPQHTQAGTPIELGLQSMKTATLSGVSSYDIYYTLVSTPSAGDWTLWTTVDASVSSTLDATALGPVKGIQVRIGTVPINFIQTTNFEFNYEVPADFPVPSDRYELIEADSSLTYIFNGSPKTINDNTFFSVVTNRPLLLAELTSNKLALNPTEVTTYTASVTNVADRSSGKLGNPTISSLLPAEMDYVPDSWTITRPAGLTTDPSFTATPQADGRTKLMWTWDDTNPGSLEIGESVTIKFDAKVKPGVAAGTLTNTLVIESPTYINNTKFSNSKAPASSYSIQQTANIQVGSSVALETELHTKGELDNEWSKYPNTATTTPGGKVLYKLVIQNEGNESLKDLVIIDKFPRIGDKTVLNSSTQRNSMWGPLLTSEIQVPSYITPYYTTTQGVTMDPITGADTGVWTASLPEDRTAVTAVKFVFDSSYVLDPLAQATIEWGMIAPVGAPTGGEVAWNSFAYKMNKASGASILPAEPLKLGVTIHPTPKASIGDFVWRDLNENGVLDGAETGVNGLKVELYDSTGSKLAETYTANDFQGTPGAYLFPNLDPGQYRVVLSPSDNSFAQVRTDLITLSAGQSHLTADFPLALKKGSVSGKVWLDTNVNGIEDTGENGENGIQIDLYNSGGTLLATTTTSTLNGVAGMYQFKDLGPGSFKLRYTLPTLHKWTTALNQNEHAFSITQGQDQSVASVGIAPSPTYTVSYDGNGATSGQAPTDSQGYEAGHSVTVAGNTGSLVKPGYTFAGWNTQADGNGTNYMSGATFTLAAANVTLYAKWKTNNTTGGGQSPPVVPPNPTPIPPEIIFSDTPKTHWAWEMIQDMAARGVIIGYEDGTFKPNQSITREQVALMIARTLELSPKRLPKMFNDVLPSHPAYESIMLLQQAGIVDGSDGAFKPNEAMTREQMAKIIVLAFGLTPGGVSKFNDVSSTDWSYDYIAALETAGIALGYNGSFNPKEPVTRVQFVAFLYRALNL